MEGRKMNRKLFLKMDNRILNICSLGMKNDFFDRMMPKISRINDYGMIYILLALISIALGYETNLAVNVIMSLTLGLFLGEGFIKHLIRRSRPYLINATNEMLIKFPRTFSFPSGHTTSSFAVFGVFWFVNSDLKYFFLLIAIIISFSRMYLYVHYPSDVFAGIILGLVCSRIIIALSSNVYYTLLVNRIVSHIYRLI
jgi:undecaprenyl-diphosphatase